MFAPLAMPILPIQTFIPYMNWLPIKIPRSEHSHERVALPQHYADQFGWNEIVQKTAEVWKTIPPDERKDCGIFGQDYGQAGAIDFLGPQYGLPPALSGHQSWWLWGPRGYSGNCLIVLDDSRERLERFLSTSNMWATRRAILMRWRMSCRSTFAGARSSDRSTSCGRGSSTGTEVRRHRFESKEAQGRPPCTSILRAMKSVIVGTAGHIDHGKLRW